MDKYIVSGFIGPTPKLRKGLKNLICNQSYKDMKDCGLDSIISISFGEDKFPKEYKQQFDYAEKNDIKVIVIDEKCYMHCESDLIGFEKEKKYENIKSFGGLLLGDEPSAKQFDKLAILNKAFYKVYPDSTAYINLLPIWAGNALLSGDDNVQVSYEKHIEELLEKVNPKYLSYDLYPFIGEFPYIREEYFENYSIISKYAKKYNKSIHSFLQTTSYMAGVRMPNKEEMLYETEVALVYGVTGFFFFTWNVPVSTFPKGESYTSSIMDINGNKTERYYFAKECVNIIRLCEKALANAEHLGVIAKGKSPAKISSSISENRVDNLVRISSNHCIAGVFEDDKNIFLFVINNSLTECAEVRIELKNGREIELVNSKKYNETKNMDLKLFVGDYVLIKYKK